MSGIIAKTAGTSFELVPSGNHVARCYSMVEIGTVTHDYMGTPKSLHKVRVSWELPFKKKVFDPSKGEQPFSIHKEYTLSMHEKSNLRHDLESWRGKGFSEAEAKAFGVLVDEGAGLKRLGIGQRTPEALAHAVPDREPLAVMDGGADVVIDTLVRGAVQEHAR